jgi:hypothetical protein
MFQGMLGLYTDALTAVSFPASLSQTLPSILTGLENDAGLNSTEAYQAFLEAFANPADNIYGKPKIISNITL